MSLSRLAGWFLILLGSVVLMGWALDVEVLKSVGPGFVSMKANTAAGFVLLGAALLVRLRAIPLPGQATALFAFVVGLLGAATLTQYAVGVDLGIDQLLFTESPGEIGTAAPGRMAPNAALAFLASAVALPLIGLERWHKHGELWAILALLVGFQGLVG